MKISHIKTHAKLFKFDSIIDIDKISIQYADTHGQEKLIKYPIRKEGISYNGKISFQEINRIRNDIEVMITHNSDGNFIYISVSQVESCIVCKFLPKYCT